MTNSTRSAEIYRLLEQAKPLRRADPDEWEANGLSALVERINLLRAEDEQERRDAFIADLKASMIEPDEEFETEPAKRGPGRPRKVD